LEATCDLVPVFGLESPAALGAHQNHPQRVPMKPFTAAVRQARRCVDYDF
jgi:hypothetical protein